MEAIERDSIALGIGHLQIAASDRASFRRHLIGIHGSNLKKIRIQILKRTGIR